MSDDKLTSGAELFAKYVQAHQDAHNQELEKAAKDAVANGYGFLAVDKFKRVSHVSLDEVYKASREMLKLPNQMGKDGLK